MKPREEFAELPLGVQIFLKGLVLGGGLGTLVSTVNAVAYLRAAEGTRGEILELGAYWTLLLGFPLSVGLGPFLIWVPWVWMVLLPALNLGLLGLMAYLGYRVVRLLPPFRD